MGAGWSWYAEAYECDVGGGIGLALLGPKKWARLGPALGQKKKTLRALGPFKNKTDENTKKEMWYGEWNK